MSVFDDNSLSTGLALRAEAPAFFSTVRKEDDCPMSAKSCSLPAYDRCCVPQKGRFVLAQQWNALDPTPAFTLHGLWPGYCDTGIGAQNCRESPQYTTLLYSVMADPALATMMNTFWPDTTGVLWTDQWNKHGTCLTTVESRCHQYDPSPNDAMRYFRLTMDLYFAYDILTELELADVVPGASYPKATFMAALNTWYGSVELRCRGTTLYEVRIHLLGMSYDNFDLDTSHAESNCHEMIFFPEKPEVTEPFVLL